MTKHWPLTFLLAITAGAAVAAPTITLPDSSIYYYWIRSKSGTVPHPPKVCSGTGEIDLDSRSPPDGVVYILDPHTGGIAEVPIAEADKGASLTVDQFHLPVAAAPALAAAQPSPQAPAATPTAPSPPSGPSVFSRVVTAILGLVVFGGVLWFVRCLLQSRGRLLVSAARKIGIDVPDPDSLPPSSVDRDGKYEPPPPIRVQRVPEDAAALIHRRHSSGYLRTIDGTSYGIDGKSITIGRGDDNDIVLADTSVSRRHARVESIGDTAEISDEGSANGVFVNGERVLRHTLSSGDQVHIGRVPLTYEK